MTRKLQNITKSKGPAIAAILILLLVWEAASDCGVVPRYMLPSPVDVVEAFVSDLPTLWDNAVITLQEAFYGLALGVTIGFGFAVAMDTFAWMYRAFYPLLVVTQTVPTVAIAPLLVLWFGYEMPPKIILIIIATFFPVTVGLLDGYRAVDPDSIRLLRSMGATRWQVFRYIKSPAALPQFFSGLRIATAYSVVAAVVSEWLGGFGGLGVYMTRVKKAFAFDKMFAVIFLISAISLVLMGLVNLLQRRCMPYAHLKS